MSQNSCEPCDDSPSKTNRASPMRSSKASKSESDPVRAMAELRRRVLLGSMSKNNRECRSSQARLDTDDRRIGALMQVRVDDAIALTKPDRPHVDAAVEPALYVPPVAA